MSVATNNGSTGANMITVIPSEQRFHLDAGWLEARWHFSFGEYHDPRNTNWGGLRVFNDDVVKPGGGFPMHPHRDMEIITYVLDGQLEHRDHLGHRGLIGAGDVQVMTAGKGIMHAEANPSQDRETHLLQIWITPRTKGNKPHYDQRALGTESRKGRLLPVVSGGDVAGTLHIDQDATIYVSSVAPGERLTHTAKRNRHAYLFVTKGRARVNGHDVSAGDQLRAKDETQLAIDAQDDTDLILLDLP